MAPGKFLKDTVVVLRGTFDKHKHGEWDSDSCCVSLHGLVSVQEHGMGDYVFVCGLM